MAKKTFFKRFWRYGLGLFLILGVVFAAWVWYVDRTVTHQFEGRRWTLPAQVYAQPIDLYAGQTLTAADLERELKRLGYQRSDTLKRPGSYRRRDSRIEFVGRRFQFPDELRESQTVAVTTNTTGIEALADGNGADLPIYRLDPLLIGSIFPIHGEDRIIVTPAEVPDLLPATLKVVEDRKFDTHFGIDPLAIMRALWVDVRSGQFEQGASTLTQQLVRSYFLNNRRTVGRKLEEALMAVLLDAHFKKADLMNAYINEIFLGQDGNRAIHGFGLASEFYFGKPLAELEPHEIATLVAIVRGPSYYDPRRRADRVKARRDLVLDLMGQFKLIPDDVARRAKARPLGIATQSKAGAGYYPAFLDFVRRTLRRDYRDEDLTEAGLKIFTTLDPLIQAKAEQSLTEELDRLEKTRKQKPGTEGLQGVVVVTSPQSGDVSAIVGGRRVGFDGFNRALDAKRSIGSLVKPVIYLAAIQTGRYTPASVIVDGPVEVKLANGQLWKPRNISQEFYGPVPLVRAIAQSLNLATVNLGLDVGLPIVAKEFTALGLEQEPQQVPALLLGALDIAPIEVAQLYNSLANGGFRTPLRGVRAILDDKGKPLKAFPLEVTPVADPAAVYQVNRMLVQVIERGSGRAARAKIPADIVIAGKTGTSSDYRDSWFAGFSGNQLAVVWIGYDDNRPTGFTGATGALPIWTRLMAGSNLVSWAPDLPEGLIDTYIDFMTGQGAKPGCVPDVIAIPVPQGTQLAMREGCSDSLKERARDWWRGIIGR
jgi:penicillin-binding protein 1B